MATKYAEAYPLYWPEGWKREPNPKRSKFKTGFGAARETLSAEIRRMGGESVVISTNIPLRNDGMPRASAREPEDAGVAVYFHRKGKDMVFACDKFAYSRDNIYAIAKTIESLRAIERYGASDMMERAFAGFKALGTGAAEAWREVLGFSVDAEPTKDDVEQAYRHLAKLHHPDTATGNVEQFQKVSAARKEALAELERA